MTISPMELYCILRLDDLKTVVEILTFVTTAAILFLTIVAFVIGNTGSSDEKIVIVSRRALKIIVIPFMLVVSINIFLPTTKQMAVLYALPPVINNEKVQQMPEQLLDLAQAWVKELMPKTTSTEGD